MKIYDLIFFNTGMVVIITSFILIALEKASILSYINIILGLILLNLVLIDISKERGKK